MKMKNPKLKKAAKQSRNNTDKRIAAAKTEHEKYCLAMYGQKITPSRIQNLVQEWSLVLDLRDNPKLRELMLKMQSEFQAANPTIPPEPSNLKRAQKNGMEFFSDAMLQWDAAAFIELGKEMKRETKRDKGYNLDHRRRALLACSLELEGKLKTGEIAEIILDEANVKINWLKKKENEERQLKRIKARWRKGDS